MAKQQNNGQEQDVNQLRKVRREKLADLQQNGKDPFQITKFNQTHHSLEVKSLYEAHEAELLKDHQTPDVEGMDEEQAKLLSVTFRIFREASRYTLQEMRSEQTLTQILNVLILVTFSD